MAEGRHVEGLQSTAVVAPHAFGARYAVVALGMEVWLHLQGFELDMAAWQHFELDMVAPLQLVLPVGYY